MTFPHADSHPFALVVFAVGLLTYLACLRIGKIVIRWLGWNLSRPWKNAVAVFLGMSLLSLSTFMIAASGLGSIPVWLGLSWAVKILGVWELIASVRYGMASVRGTLRNPTIPFFLAVAAGMILLLIALAPSSKIDELYYHMLAPQRLAREGQLIFYRFPWEGAVLPQMHYQIAATFTQAEGIADASNVTSWCFAMHFATFASSLVFQSTSNRWLGSLVSGAGIIGMIPAVTFVTAGAHAYGQFASAALVLGAVPGTFGRRIFPATGASRIGCLAIFAAAAATSKVTLIPLSALCLVVAIGSVLWIARKELSQSSVAIALSLLPAIGCYLPLLIWTWIHSGSPFGPILSGKFPNSAYAPGEAESILDATLRKNRLGWSEFAFYAGVAYSPLVWLGTAFVALVPELSKGTRLYAIAVCLLQFGLIFTVVQNDVRFLGGIPPAMLILSAIGLPKNGSASWFRINVLRWTALGLLIPWVAMMAYYSLPFAKVSLGTQSREDFTRQFTAFREDFLKLDELLPADAELLVCGSRLNSANAPRPVCLHPRDAHAERVPFLFSVDGEESLAHRYSIRDNYIIGELIYQNENAIAIAFRRPGSVNATGNLRVYRLEKKLSPLIP